MLYLLLYISWLNKIIINKIVMYVCFLKMMATDSKIDWDYYCFYLMIIHALWNTIPLFL